MSGIEIYTKNWCPYCAKAKELLRREDLHFHELDVTFDAEKEFEMVERSGRHTVPQIFIHGQPIGGSDDLAAAHESGLLRRLLNKETKGEVV